MGDNDEHSIISELERAREREKELEKLLAESREELSRLRQSESTYRDIFQNMLDGYYSADTEGRLVAASPSAVRIFGYDSLEEVKGKYLAETFYVNPGDRERFLQALSGGGVANYVINMKRKDGGRLDVETSSKLVYSSDGKNRVVGIKGIFRDVTEKLKVKRMLEKSEEKYKKIFHESKDGVLLIYKERFIDCNEAAMRMMGYTDKQEFMNVHPIDISPVKQPDGSVSKQRSVDIFRQAHEKGYLRFEWIHRRKDGRDFPVEVSLTKIVIDDKEHFYVVWRDITERVKVEAALRESEENYRHIFNAVNEAIFVNDPATGKILDANRSAVEKFGYEVEELKRLQVSQLSLDPELLEAERLEELLRLTLDKGPQVIELKALRKDGGWFWCEASLRRAKVAGQWRVLAVARDISERKRILEMMIQTEKMMSIGGMAAGMAHEINNPLGIILAGAQSIARRLSPGLKSNTAAANEAGIDLKRLEKYMKRRQVLEYLEGVRTAGIRAAQIVKSMLDFSRKGETPAAPTDVHELLEKAVDLASRDYDLKKAYDFRSIEIIRDYSPNLPRMNLSETQMEQVFLNLLKNAAQAMYGKKYKEGEGPLIFLRTRLEQGYVVLEVEDNGPGLDLQTRKRIFEPFFTTKPPGEGTGLGLSVSYFLITQNHGGEFMVDSAPGRGARFIIRLPAANAEVQQ